MPIVNQGGDVAGDVLTLVRSLMNDADKDPVTGNLRQPAVFTDVFLLPFLNSSYRRLQRDLIARGVKARMRSEAVITLPLGGTQLDDIGAAPNAFLPNDFLAPYSLWERPANSTSRKQEMFTTTVGLPNRDPMARLRDYEFIEDVIRFVGATQDVEITMRYQPGLAKLTDANAPIRIRDAVDALAARTAALAARSRGVTQLTADLYEAYDEELKLMVAGYFRGQQSQPIRRRPYGKRRRVLYI